MDRLRLGTMTVILCAALFAQPGSARGEEDDACLCRDMIVTCSVVPRSVVLGDPFEVCATVKSVGAVTLTNVRLSLRGCPRAKSEQGAELSVVIPSLAQGQTYTHCVTLQCLEVGECRIIGHAVDDTGVAAAGCVCTALCRGLPALQLEMIDTALDRTPKGIFREGEEFLYRLEVENDVGSALTPDLRIQWSLPPELEFVRGRGERGNTVAGAGQAASSSRFVLRPNERLIFELVCRVADVPPQALVQARAAVVTDLAGVELAVETESTTLKR